jgi:hypothetical protein
MEVSIFPALTDAQLTRLHLTVPAKFLHREQQPCLYPTPTFNNALYSFCNLQVSKILCCLTNVCLSTSQFPDPPCNTRLRHGS